MLLEKENDREINVLKTNDKQCKTAKLHRDVYGIPANI